MARIPDADAPRRAKPVGPDPDGEGPPPARRTTPGRRRPRRSRSWWAIGLVVLALILLISVRHRPLDGGTVVPERPIRRGLLDAVHRSAGPIPRLRRSARSRSSSSTCDRCASHGRHRRRSQPVPRPVRAPPSEAAANSGRGGARSNAGAPRPVTFGPEEFPDLTPIARVVLVGLAIFVAITIGASVASVVVHDPPLRIASPSQPTLRRPWSTRSSAATSGSSCSSCRSCASCSRCSTAS